MHYENKNYNMLENESSKDNELLLNDSDLSSIKQKIRELETKMSGLPKDNKINKIYQSNYSFSDKTLGNEISRAKTESLEQELLSTTEVTEEKVEKSLNYEMLSEEAKNALDSADIILSKGQGNYETLNGQGRHIFYAFLCKCELFTSRFDVPRLTGILVEENSER